MNGKTLYPVIMVFLFAIGLLAGCPGDPESDGKTLARINDYRLSLSDFQYQLANELEMDRTFKVTDEARKAFLEDIIRKELLLQEAERLKLDREEKFIRAIERYWEATLIRDLMEKKSREIDDRIFITEEELKTYYEERKARDPALAPLNQVEEELGRELREIKKTETMRQWMDELRQKAVIEINDRLLESR